MSFGLDLSICKFLQACLIHDCARRGAKLAAILSLDQPSQLLPTKATVKTRFIDEVGHSRGDHLTLLNMVTAYLEAMYDDASSLVFQENFGVDISLLADFDHMHHYILGRLSNMKELQTGQDDESDNAIIAALCATFCDQTSALRTPGRRKVLSNAE